MRVKVKNRSKNRVGYTIPEDGITRIFAPGESKEILVTELEKLTYQPGGQVILSEYLLINDKTVAQQLNTGSIEPEYWMDEEEIISLMKHGSLDRFLDCLDFAPEGVIDLIKSLAVSLPLNDLSKLEAIKKATGFDAARAIQINKEAQEPDAKENENSRGRRVAIEPIDEVANAPVRRIVEETAPVINKYEVVNRS